MLCPCICLACVACYLLTSACVCARVYMLSYICAHVPACGGEAQSPVPVDKEQAPSPSLHLPWWGDKTACAPRGAQGLGLGVTEVVGRAQFSHVYMLGVQ